MPDAIPEPESGTPEAILTPDQFAYEMGPLWRIDDKSADRVTRHDQALRRSVERLTAERDALREAVRQLHSFIVRELDPDPTPVADYLTDAAAQEAATLACALDPEVQG